MCNTNSFSSAAMVARTHLYVSYMYIACHVYKYSRSVSWTFQPTRNIRTPHDIKEYTNKDEVHRYLRNVGTDSSDYKI
jgi:hypothetical protein